MEQKERIELLAKNGWRVKGLTAEGFVIFSLADSKTLTYYHGQYLTKKEYDKSIKKRHLPDYGLMKIPDAYFLRLARREIGELKSYIQELEDKIKTLQEQQLSNETLRVLIGKSKQEIKRLNAELSELRERLRMAEDVL